MQDGFFFSEDLIIRAIAYYSLKGEDLTPEIAQGYLYAMTGLYESMMVFSMETEGEAGGLMPVPALGT